MALQKIVDDAYLIPMGQVNAVLLDGGDELALIDAGFPNKERLVLDAIAELGRKPSTRYRPLKGTFASSAATRSRPGRCWATGKGGPARRRSRAPAGTPDLSYPAKITLDRNWIVVAGRHEPVQAGMRVTAEIKTGDRKALDYLLSPVTQAVQEAGRER